MARLSVNILTYNSERYVRDLCVSLRAQTYSDFSVLAIDNDSRDRSVEIFSEELPDAHISKQNKNTGFAQGHNLGIVWSDGEYVAIVNHDIVLDPNCLELLIAELDADASLGAVGPELLLMNEDTDDGPVVDSLGLSIHKNMHVTDIAQGKNLASSNMTSDVFGVSGAFTVFRRAALEDIAFEQSGSSTKMYFDELYFMYKEDVDLAWRLQLAGWNSRIVSGSRAYHKRTVSAIGAGWKERKKRRHINIFSYRNNLYTVYKNIELKLLFKYGVYIIPYEVAKFVYLLVLDGSSMVALRDIVRNRKELKRRRTFIQGKKKRSIVSWIK